jgi:hypothetical protein
LLVAILDLQLANLHISQGSSRPHPDQHHQLYHGWTLPVMPPQIKQDLNRSGWETTDFPSVCENCLPENPYVKMLKEDYGAECKLVSRRRRRQRLILFA